MNIKIEVVSPDVSVRIYLAVRSLVWFTGTMGDYPLLYCQQRKIAIFTA